MKFFFASLAATLLSLPLAHDAHAIQKGTEEKPTKTDLKPGEYVWDSKDAYKDDKGSVDIVVSLGAQLLFVYRDGVLVGRSTISSGIKGRETPKAIYMILEKNVTHHSNKYHEASMPFMERLTWGGLAIHAGNTPGHPESHGCMHVPMDFAKDLYGITQEGNTVLVADGNTQAQTTADPNALFAGGVEDSPTPTATPAFTWDPQKVPSGPVSIVFTSVDKRVYVYRKGVEIGQADLGGPDAGKSCGNAVYAALDQTTPDGGRQWNLLGTGDGSPTPDFQAVAKGWTLPPGFRQHLGDLIKPGTTLVITDQAANPTKPSNPDAED